MTQHVADRRDRFSVRLVGGEVCLIHGVEYAAVDGLQSVAHVRQGAADDNAHRVVEKRASDLFFNVDLNDLLTLKAYFTAVFNFFHFYLLN